MKKRVLCVALALVFCLSLLPTAALATEYDDISATGVTITADSVGTTYKAGDGTVAVSLSNSVLTVALSDAVIGSEDALTSQGIYVDDLSSRGVKKISVILSGESSIYTSGYGLSFTGAPVTVSGTGTLNLIGTMTVTVTATEVELSKKGTLPNYFQNVTYSSPYDAIVAENADLEFSSGTVNMVGFGGCGIYAADGGVTVDGTASVTSSYAYEAGIFLITGSKTVTNNSGVTVKDSGSLTICGSKDGIYSLLMGKNETYVEGYINISGSGEVYITDCLRYGAIANTISISDSGVLDVQVSGCPSGSAVTYTDMAVCAYGAYGGDVFKMSGGTLRVRAVSYGMFVGYSTKNPGNMVVSGNVNIDVGDTEITGDLILNNASVEGSIGTVNSLYVVLNGKNTFTPDDYCDAFRVLGCLYFTGSGSLDITGGDYAVWTDSATYTSGGTTSTVYGVLIVDGPTVTVENSRGIYTEVGLEVYSGALTVRGEEQNIWAEYAVIVDEGGTLNTDYVTVFEGGKVSGYSGPVVWFNYDDSGSTELYTFRLSGSGTVDASVINSRIDGLQVDEGAVMTVGHDTTLDDELAVTGDLTNNGTIKNSSRITVYGDLVNNGTFENDMIIVLYGEDIDGSAIASLNLQGDGVVVAMASSAADSGAVYTNSGEKLGDVAVISGNANLTTAAGIAALPDGIWDADTKTLTLNNTYINGYLRLPAKSTVVIDGVSGIGGAVKTSATLKMKAGSTFVLGGDMTVLNSADVSQWLQSGASISSGGKIDGPAILSRDADDKDDDEDKTKTPSGGGSSSSGGLGGGSGGGSSSSSGSGGSSGGSGGTDESFGGFADTPDDNADDGIMPLDGASHPYQAFSDVADGQWYCDAVDYVVEHGLMEGYDGKFDPDDDLTRAELAQILYNYMDKPEVTEKSPFLDVADGQWYTSAVIWADKEGYATGYGDGDFGPDDDVTREQMVTILWRMAGCPKVSSTALSWPDAGSISDWAVNAMAWAVENGIIHGSDGLLSPQGVATRAQAAQLLENYLG